MVFHRFLCFLISPMVVFPALLHIKKSRNKKSSRFKVSVEKRRQKLLKRAELKSFMWICIYHNMLDFLSYTFYKPGSLLWQVFKFFPRLKVQQKVHFGLISNFFQRQNFEFLSYKKFQWKVHRNLIDRKSMKSTLKWQKLQERKWIFLSQAIF